RPQPPGEGCIFDVKTATRRKHYNSRVHLLFSTVMRTDTAPTILRHDYQPYPYRLTQVFLDFELDPAQTRVQAQLQFEATGATPQALVLNGQELQLESLFLNDRPLTPGQYQLQDDTLVVH